MRRIPWLAIALLAGLLVVTLPLASAQPAQQQFGVGVYLPLVYQGTNPTLTNPTTAPFPTRTLSPGGIQFAIDELYDRYYAGDDVSVVGTLIDAAGDGMPNIVVTVRYTMNGTDAGVWCTTTTNVYGDWECPDKTVPASWVNKQIRITATAVVQGLARTDAAAFVIELDDAFPGTPTPSLTPTASRTVTRMPPAPTATEEIIVVATNTPTPTSTRDPAVCAAEYPTVCIPPPPPDLNCPDIPYHNFPVLPPDRHRFDSDGDGVGCES
jgi:hypothetical protein